MQNHETSVFCHNGSQIAVRNLRKLFYHIGIFVGNYAWSCILLSLLCTIVIVPIGLYNFVRNEDVKLQHTPLGARTFEENRIYKEFFSNRGDPFTSFITVTARDGGSLLREGYMESALNISQYIINKLTTEYHGRNITFSDFNHPYEQINQPVEIFTELLQAQQRQLNSYGTVESRIHLSYPESSFMGQKINMMPYLFGVEMKNGTNKNKTEANWGPMDSLHMVMFHIRADMANQTRKDQVKEWERAVVKLFREQDQDSLIDWIIMCDEYITQSVSDNGAAINPFFAVGFLMLMCFSFVTVSCSFGLSPNSNPDLSFLSPYKLVVALAAVVSPVVAVGTAMPLLFTIGLEYDAILSVTPFLTLAIGVDDAFLMIHAWLRTDKSINVPERLGKSKLLCRIGRVLSDVGPSITITSLTNCLAFGIGTISATPVINVFCTCTACCIAMDFVYQVTIFAAVLALFGRSESKSLDEEKITNCCIATRTNQSEIIACDSQTSDALQIKKTKSKSKFLIYAKAYLLKYCNLLCTKPIQIFVPFVLIFYWCVSLLWTINMPVSIEDHKLFLADAPIQKLVQIRFNFIWKSYTPFHVFVNNPPDFTDPNQYFQFDTMLKEFHLLKHSLGEKYTELWLNDFDTFLQFIQCADGDNIMLCSNFFGQDFLEPSSVDLKVVANDAETSLQNNSIIVQNNTIPDVFYKKAERFSLELLPIFLENPEYSNWDTWIIWSRNKTDSSIKLDKFLLTTALSNVSQWDTRKTAMVAFRDIGDRYSQFNVSIWEMESPYYDQMLSLRDVTLKTAGITLVCMAIVCLALIPAIPSVLVASVSTASITIGVCGLLHFFSIDLDPISMSSILMSIGLSVDYVAHISYHYFQTTFLIVSEKHEAKTLLGFKVNTVEAHRLLSVLSSVGWPILQAATSTVICVLPLFFVNGYISRVFTTVVILVVVLGLFHGLFLVPVIMTIMPDNSGKLPTSSLKSNSGSHCSNSKSTSSDSGIEDGEAATSPKFRRDADRTNIIFGDDMQTVLSYKTTSS